MSEEVEFYMTVVEPEERYLGGFYSIQMGLGGGRNQSIGYGIYVTNKRLFGTSHQRPSFDKNVPLIPQNLPQETNNRIITEIKQKSSLEIPLEKIGSIELKIPPGAFRTGHLEIRLITGESATIRVGRKQPGEQLRDLLRLFSPNNLTVS